MTALRDRLIGDLRLRGLAERLSERTVDAYVGAAPALAQLYWLSPH